jgi:hypothetical protein
VDDVLTYTVTITNRGPGTADDVSRSRRASATHVSTGLVYVSGGILDGTDVCRKIRSLAARHSRSFVVRAPSHRVSSCGRG